MSTVQGTFDHALLESDERRALRAAVGDLGRRYGREYFTATVRAGKHTDELWQEAGRLGYLGVNLPEEYGGGGGGLAELALVLEELGAAGCPLLLMVVSPAICGTVIARFGTAGPEAALAAGPGGRLAADGVRHHRAGRGLQLAPHHHHRPPRPGHRRLAADRPQGLHLRRRHRRRDPRSWAAPRTPAPASSSRACSSWSGRRPASSSGRSRWNSARPRSSSSSSWTTWRCPPTRWSATRTPGCSSSSPGSTPSG